MENEIPKLIIQTGPTEKLSVLENAAVYTVKNLNPDFEYMFFDNNDVEEFIDSCFPKYRNIFESFTYKIQKYDFFRYLAIYYYGGFYFDLDVFLVKSLKPLIEYSCVFSFEELTSSQYLRNKFNLDWEVGNYAFCACPEHPFIRKIIDNCIRSLSDQTYVNSMLKSIPRLFRSDFFVLSTTGPAMVARTIAENPDESDELTVLFPENVCERKTWGHFGNFGVHLGAGNWRQESGGPGHGIKRFIEQRWFDWIRKRQLKESRKRGPKRGIGDLRK